MSLSTAEYLCAADTPGGFCNKKVREACTACLREDGSVQTGVIARPSRLPGFHACWPY